MKYILILMFALFLNGCAIFGDPTELDDTKGWTAERIYEEGQTKMRDKDYEKALVYFGKLESRYPNGRYAAQAQLETAYAHYKKQDPVLCVAAADRFIKLHPNHTNVDYAYYLKGIAVFSERGVIEKFTEQQISDRDPRSLRDSFTTFKELVTRYPNSRYTKDATQRMVYLANSLSDHELHVARYYMKRQAYIAAINRCKYVLEYFPQAPGVEQALVIMISAYDLLSLEDLKNDTLRILKTNYPNNPMLSGKVTNDERIWWKFWESMY
ncbi:MAG: outer membrane protein assembly factor BamD [Methylotenera sp.]|nr:outer membrane protein assembly factor BamD [Methylotenera sp.]